MNWTLGVVDTVLCLTAGIGVGVVYFLGTVADVEKSQNGQTLRTLAGLQLVCAQRFYVGGFLSDHAK